MRRTPLLAVVFLSSAPACRASELATASPSLTGASAAGATATNRAGLDAFIDEAVRERLREDGAIADAKIRVQTTNGIVELTGIADNLLAIERAASIAELVKGVRSVSNRIALHRPQVDDSRLARDVVAALRADPVTERLDLPVAVDGGLVRLRGSVPSIVEKRFAERVVKGVRGVAGVDNLIDLTWTGERTDDDIERDIDGRLRWDALVDDALVRADVTDGRVSLIGTVGSAAEKSRAVRDAWVTGVTAVDAALLAVDPSAGRANLRKDKYVVKPASEVARAIRDALAYDPRVRSAEVHVVVDGRLATLSGAVPNLAASAAAEQVARDTVGIAAVANELSVANGRPISDAALRREVEGVLEREPLLDARRIAVTVRGGTVVLSGKVDSSFEKAAATSAVTSLRGVSAIENELDVARPRPSYVYNPYVDRLGGRHGPGYVISGAAGKSDSDIAREIARDLERSPQVRASDIRVTVRDGRATLTGTVTTWREKAVATESAVHGGAVSVDNRLDVAP